MTQTGMVVGTPQYLSPEQALGRGVDARSDLYSVGIMLFQLLTGRLPFDADSPLAIAYAHVQEEPVAPSSINRSVTPAMDALVARALKKNPNERFPSAAAMRDECARVAGAGQTGAPVIITGAPANSGAGVGSAVFPPLDQSAPPPQSGVQTPYHPSPYGAPTPAPTPAPHYGYPTPAPAYQSPAPAVATPPPYTISPQQPPVGGSGGGKRNMPVVVGAIAVAVLAIGGLITAIALNGEDDPGTEAGGDPTTSESQKAGYKGPERERTMKTTECSDARESYNDPSKVDAPNFAYKDILSVKACVQAAGWKINEKEAPNAQWGDGIVISQFPLAGSEVDPENANFTLEISNGYPE